MKKAGLIFVLVGMLAACSTVPQPNKVEADIALACQVPAIAQQFAAVCANPAQYAQDAAIAAQIFAAARNAVAAHP